MTNAELIAECRDRVPREMAWTTEGILEVFRDRTARLTDALEAAERRRFDDAMAAKKSGYEEGKRESAQRIAALEAEEVEVVCHHPPGMSRDGLRSGLRQHCLLCKGTGSYKARRAKP